MRFASVLIVLFFCMALPAIAMRIYTCKGPTGKIELTDRPCDTASSNEALRPPPPPKTQAGLCNAARAALRTKDTAANRAAVQRTCPVP